MASTTAQDVTQGLEGNSRSLEHHSEMHWGPPMKFTNVGCRPCARPSESPLCNPTQCPASRTHTAIPPGDTGHGGPGMKWSPVLTCRTVGLGDGWDGNGLSHMVVIVLLESSSNLEKMLTSYSSQVIFFKILITSIIHQKKHKLCPHVLNIIRSTHTVWMEHIKISPTSAMDAQPRQGSRASGLTVLKFLELKTCEVTCPACG